MSTSPDKAATTTGNSDTGIESQNHTSNKLEATAEHIDTTHSFEEQAAKFLKLVLPCVQTPQRRPSQVDNGAKT